MFSFTMRSLICYHGRFSFLQFNDQKSARLTCNRDELRSIDDTAITHRMIQCLLSLQMIFICVFMKQLTDIISTCFALNFQKLFRLQTHYANNYFKKIPSSPRTRPLFGREQLA